MRINGKTVPLEDHKGLVDVTETAVGNVRLQFMLIDSQKTARSTLYQGIAFWQARKLVGEPSWILGRTAIVDGRTTFARRYSIVVKTDDLAEFILEDWSGFKQVDELKPIFESVGNYANEMQNKIARNRSRGIVLSRADPGKLRPFTLHKGFHGLDEDTEGSFSL